VVREELHVGDLAVLGQAVQLDTVPVVDVDVVLLRNGEELVVVQPPRVPDGLPQLQLAPKLAFPPVHRGDVALAPRQQQLPAISRVLCDVGAELVKLEVEALLCGGDSDFGHDVALSHLVGPLELAFGLEEAGGVLEEDLGVACLEGGGLVLVFEALQVSAQLLVLDCLEVNLFATAIFRLGLLLALELVAFGFGGKVCRC
jgi:hypothetical protein